MKIIDICRKIAFRWKKIINYNRGCESITYIDSVESQVNCTPRVRGNNTELSIFLVKKNTNQDLKC